MNTAQNLMSFEAHRDHRNTMIYHSVASRRGVLLSLGALGLGSLGLALTSCSSTTGINAGATDSPTASGSPNASASVAPSGSESATPSAAPSSGSTQTPGNLAPTPRPWDGPQTGLVGEGKYVAWTVDDGANPDVVRAYAEFARRTGTRLTFFINGQYPSFEQHRDLLLPLVKSGQLQIANHTYRHAALTKLSDEQIVRELTRNDEEIQRLFGVSSKPYFRPPRTGIMIRACWRLQPRAVSRARCCGMAPWLILRIFPRRRCFVLRRSTWMRSASLLVT